MTNGCDFCFVWLHFPSYHLMMFFILYHIENERLTNPSKITPYYGLFLYKFLEKFSKIWAKDADVFLEIKFIRNFPFRTLHKVLQT